MEHIADKTAFLRNELVAKLKQIDPATKGKWGKMNVQQMIEHMSYALRQANGRDKYQLVNDPEIIPKMQAFIMSDKEFRENTANKMLPDEPLPLRHMRIDDAIAELDGEIQEFFRVFEKDQQRIIINPLFGDLNYELWVRLLYKHAMHHLRQFGSE
jgi:hypothetical protein